MPAAAIIAAVGTALGVVTTAVGPILSKRKSNKEEEQEERLAMIRQQQMGNVSGTSFSSPGATKAKSFVEENKTVILIALSALSVLFIFKSTFRK